MTDLAAPTTKRPAAQVEYAKKAAELKGSNAEPSCDSWSRFFDAPTPPLTVSVKEAARLSGLSKTTIWKCISSGLLRSTSVGRNRLVHFSSLETPCSRREPEPKSRDIATHFQKWRGAAMMSGSFQTHAKNGHHHPAAHFADQIHFAELIEPVARRSAGRAKRKVVERERTPFWHPWIDVDRSQKGHLV